MKTTFSELVVVELKVVGTKKQAEAVRHAVGRAITDELIVDAIVDLGLGKIINVGWQVIGKSQ